MTNRQLLMTILFVEVAIALFFIEATEVHISTTDVVVASSFVTGGAFAYTMLRDKGKGKK